MLFVNMNPDGVDSCVLTIFTTGVDKKKKTHTP